MEEILLNENEMIDSSEKNSCTEKRDSDGQSSIDEEEEKDRANSIIETEKTLSPCEFHNNNNNICVPKSPNNFEKSPIDTKSVVDSNPTKSNNELNNNENQSESLATETLIPTINLPDHSSSPLDKMKGNSQEKIRKPSEKESIQSERINEDQLNIGEQSSRQNESANESDQRQSEYENDGRSDQVLYILPFQFKRFTAKMDTNFLNLIV